MGRCATLAVTTVMALAGGAGRSQAAEAASCQLVKLAELAVTRTPLGPTVTAAINRIDAPFLVDTGAVFSMISPKIATQYGLKAEVMDGVLIAGATAHKAEIKDFALGGAAAGDVDLLVADLNGVAPDMTGVLGQNLLGVTDVEYDLAAGVIRLFQPQACGAAARAYWSPAHRTVQIATLRPTSLLIEAAVSVNGQALHARFDTGIPVSVLSLAAAARIGLTPQTPGAAPAEPATVGLSHAPSWTVPADSLSIGDDTQARPRLRIADVSLPAGVDMLIGADFFAAHRIYVVKDQRRLEFTDAR